MKYHTALAGLIVAGASGVNLTGQELFVEELVGGVRRIPPLAEGRLNDPRINKLLSDVGPDGEYKQFIPGARKTHNVTCLEEVVKDLSWFRDSELRFLELSAHGTETEGAEGRGGGRDLGFTTCPVFSTGRCSHGPAIYKTTVVQAVKVYIDVAFPGVSAPIAQIDDLFEVKPIANWNSWKDVNLTEGSATLVLQVPLGQTPVITLESRVDTYLSGFGLLATGQNSAYMSSFITDIIGGIIEKEEKLLNEEKYMRYQLNPNSGPDGMALCKSERAARFIVEPAGAVAVIAGFGSFASSLGSMGKTVGGYLPPSQAPSGCDRRRLPAGRPAGGRGLATFTVPEAHMSMFRMYHYTPGIVVLSMEALGDTPLPRMAGSVNEAVAGAGPGNSQVCVSFCSSPPCINDCSFWSDSQQQTVTTEVQFAHYSADPAPLMALAIPHEHVFVLQSNGGTWFNGGSSFVGFYGYGSDTISLGSSGHDYTGTLTVSAP